MANSRLDNPSEVAAELDEVQPTHVLNAAGLTGRPNVDWCESNKLEVLRVNVIGTMNLADMCNERGIHCTMYATGCIYEYVEEHTIGGPGFTEDEVPNFHGSFYSKTKAMVETMLREYPTILILRIRMPISDDLSERNFITKISRYEKVVNIPNSMTVLSDLMPVSLNMAERRLSGVYNFCNPGAISHNEILDKYREYIDQEFTYENFTIEEQAKVIVAQRSNNTLDCTKLVNAMKDQPGLEVQDIHTSIVGVFERMRQRIESK